MPKNPFDDPDFWPGLLVIIGAFVAGGKVEVNGPTLFDRAVTEADIAFMKDLQLKDMEFVLPASDEKDEKVNSQFTIKHKDRDKGLAFSNRPATRGEMRAERLRERLENLKAENDQLTLYQAIEKLYCENFKDSDLMQAFLFSEVFLDREINERVDVSYQNATKQMGELILQFIKDNPDAKDGAVIAYGQANMTRVMPMPPQESNKTSMAAKILGFTLFALGIVLAFAPIPVVAQVVGSWLASVGIGIAVGAVTLGIGLTTAAVGLSVFAFGTLAKPPTLDEKNLSKLTAADENRPNQEVVDNVVADDNFKQQLSSLKKVTGKSSPLETAEKYVASVHTIQSNKTAKKSDMDQNIDSPANSINNKIA